MAKDDYFILAYRILSYLYACFKAGERPDTELFGPDALKISKGYWANILESLYNEGYIIGIAFLSAVGSTDTVKLINLKITQKGIEFLQENTMMQKSKDFLKEIKEIVPGL